jgi:DNA-binding transcriptional MerR regulator
MTHGDCFTFGKGKDSMSMKEEERYPFLTETRPDGSKWSDEELEEQRRLIGIIEEDFEKEAKQKQDKERLKKRLREDKEALRQEIRELKKQHFFLKVSFLFDEYFWGTFHKLKKRLKEDKEALKQLKKQNFFSR